MKILFVIENLKLGGKQRRLIQLIKGLNKYDDIESSLVILSDDIEYKEVYNIIKPIHIIKRRRKKDINQFIKLIRCMRQIKPDIVHTWGSMSSIIALPAIILRRLKLVNSMIVHATPLKLTDEDWIRSKLTFPFSKAIIANSNAGLKAFNVRKRGAVIYNGFDFQRLKDMIPAETIRKKWNIQTKLVVGMVAAFEDRKDYALLISAAQKILESRRDISFILVGGGKNLDRCKNLVVKKNQKNIIFTGKQDNVESLIQIFTIGVLLTCSELHSEGISNSILEYMAVGKPVIATKGGGTNEIIQEGETGFLVEGNNQRQFIDKVTFLIDQPGICNTMGEKAKQQIKNHFNLNKMTDEYISIYNKLV